MEESYEISDIKKRTIFSTLSLFFQSGYAAILGLIANLVITILLSPTIFGIYIVVLSIISLLNYFSDIGLAASLVQRKEISKDDIKTTFTIQQLLIIAIITIGYLSTSFIRKFYNLPIEGIYLYWALLMSFFISSLKTIPSIFLERKIQFQKIVLVQIIENTVFYLTVIILALLNFSLNSFTIAVILRSITGLIIIYIILPWKPQFGISYTNLKHLLSFGIPFQASSFLALFKDDLITLFLGKILGFEGLGYIGWAKKWAEAPIRIVMDSISRVLFPVFSRIQNDRKKMSNLVEKILYYQTIILAPTILGSITIINLLVNIIPKYSKWSPALPLFYIFSICAMFTSYSTPFINLFNALGKAKVSFLFMVFWTVTTWILTPIFTRLYGYYGFPMTQLILSSTFVIVMLTAKKEVNFSFIKPIIKPFISALIMFIGIMIINKFLTHSFISLILLIISGVLIYLTTFKFIFNINLINEVKKIFTYE